MRSAATLAFLAALVPAAAPAQPAEDIRADRFVLEKSEEGFVRMDRQTGAMSYCTLADGTLTCRMAADEKQAFETELDRLEKRVAALEGREPSSRSPLPSDAEIDKSISIMERFMRAFMNLVEEFSGRQQQPDRT
ncbi:hypothetical protein [Ectorhizobium quercum]